MSKLTEMPHSWINWIKECYQQGSDFSEMKNILLKHFDNSVVDYWIDQIWQQATNSHSLEYDLNHSWLNSNILCSHGVKIQYLHKQPVVAVFKNILSDAECDNIVQSYTQGNQESRATVYDNKTGGSRIDDARTNSLTHIHYGDHAMVIDLEKRIADVSRLHLRRGESCQLLHYQVGEEYTPHDDFFHSDGASSNISTYGQRIATVITYLNDVDGGGETHFPALDITVAPHKGDALYFEYTDSRGRSTDLCRHASLPVTNGEKWAITKWLRLGFSMPEAEYLSYYQ